MTTIRLTEAAWLERELNRIRAVLTQNLTRAGIDQNILARLLKRYLGMEYTGAELLAFHDALVAEGLIEDA